MHGRFGELFEMAGLEEVGIQEGLVVRAEAEIWLVEVGLTASEDFMKDSVGFDSEEEFRAGTVESRSRVIPHTRDHELTPKLCNPWEERHIRSA